MSPGNDSAVSTGEFRQVGKQSFSSVSGTESEIGRGARGAGTVTCLGHESLIHRSPHPPSRAALSG